MLKYPSNVERLKTGIVEKYYSTNAGKMKTTEAPHSKESEMMVLGCMLTNAASLDIAAASLEESHFYISGHKIIFWALKSSHATGKAADIHLIGEELKTQQKLDEVGGIGYLASLAQYAGTSAYIEEYIEILQANWKRRRLLAEAKSLEKSALKGDVDPDILAKEFRQSIDRISDFDEKILMPAFYTHRDFLTDLNQSKEGLKTGYSSLDEIIEIPQGAITLVAGRPSHGKTITQLNLLVNMVKNYPLLNFYFFSYEEPKSQIFLKILNILAGDLIDESHNLSNVEGYFRGNHKTRKKLNAAAEELQHLTETGRLVVSDHSYYVDDLSLVIAKLKKRYNDKMGAIFIDYIQKIKIKYRFPTRQLELQKISAEILEAAKIHHLPIVLGAQLGRGVGKKEVLRLDNLREAGDIENDAKLVLGIWNQAKEEADGRQETFKGRISDIEFVVLKNRNGPSNQSVFLEFDRPLSMLREKIKEDFFSKKS